MNKSVDFAGPLVFNGTVEQSAIGRRKWSQVVYIRCSCFSLEPASVWVSAGTFWSSYKRKTDYSCSMSYERLSWMSEGKLVLWNISRHGCKFSCPPSCHSEVPSSLFSRFSWGLMKIEVFYGCWRHWICTRSLCCGGSNGLFLFELLAAVSMRVYVSVCFLSKADK